MFLICRNCGQRWETLAVERSHHQLGLYFTRTSMKIVITIIPATTTIIRINKWTSSSSCISSKCALFKVTLGLVVITVILMVIISNSRTLNTMIIIAIHRIELYQLWEATTTAPTRTAILLPFLINLIIIIQTTLLALQEHFLLRIRDIF